MRVCWLGGTPFRLKSNLELNITDEYAASKLKQKRYHKLHRSQDGTTMFSLKAKRKEQDYKNIAINNTMNKNQHENNSKIGDATQMLQDAINIIKITCIFEKQLSIEVL